MGVVLAAVVGAASPAAAHHSFAMYEPTKTLTFKGTVKWTVTLQAGTYTFRSDAHRALKGTLKVT